MTKIITIARRELKGYFDSPIAYIVVGVFLVLSGWWVFNLLFLPGREIADLRALFTPSVWPHSPAFVLIILTTALTMRLVAEERKSGTLELLTTMPVRDVDVVLGKYFAALSLTVIAVLSTAVYALCVALIGSPDLGPVVTGYVGMILFVGTLTAIGLMCSTWTSNQVVAFIIAVLICGVLYYVYWLHFFMPDFLAPVVEYISISAHLENMARGVLDSRDVIYYLTLTAGALFIAERSLARQHA